MNDDVLRGHLQHHWAGATGGLAFFRRVAGSFPDDETATELTMLAAEVAEDRESLRAIMVGLGYRPSPVGAVSARVGEWLGRFKPNGRILRRSPLTDVVELEALRLAVTGKRNGFELLREAADPIAEVAGAPVAIDVRILDLLVERADRQLEVLRELHLGIGGARIRGQENTARTNTAEESH